MRENLFLQSHERKNPVNEQANDLIQNLADSRINDLVKTIIDTQKEFVRKGKELISYFGAKLPIFVYAFKHTQNIQNEEKRNLIF